MIDGALYSDGALLCNNPSAVAVHEAQVMGKLDTSPLEYNHAMFTNIVDSGEPYRSAPIAMPSVNDYLSW